MNHFAIADPPITAVVAHGAGGDSVAGLEMAVCGESLLWLVYAVDELRAAGVDKVAIDQVAAIAGGLISLDAGVVRTLYRDVLWRVWLAGLRQLMDAPGVERSQLEGLLLRLPLLVAPLLAQLDAGPAWKAVLPGALRVGPAGGDVYLSSASGVDLGVDLVSEGSTWQVCAGGEDLATLARSPLVVTPRSRVGHGIDVLEAASFPELTLIRRSIEVTSTAETGEIDTQLADVFALLGQGWPAAVDDVQAFFRGLLPISSGPGHWNSASTDAIPLTLQLTFPDVSTPLALGESVVHETAHVKLDLLMTMVPLLDNSADRQYRHPWREDLRPLSGVLIGAHAFLNVVVYYRQMLDAGLGGAEAEREFIRRQGEVLSALELLSDNAHFTFEGLALFEAMVAALRRTDCQV